ncbi:MAG: hypothetical protein KDC53_15470 [Saprospiraceae bacterium]|nr:hypothetical protein [Saprospiraceae bacterium]
MTKIVNKSEGDNLISQKQSADDSPNLRVFDVKKTTFENQIVDNTLILKKGQFLGDVLNVLPCGIIDKKVTGIGATSLALQSLRNSIVVVPTKYLAASKAKKHGAYYVGSKTKDSGESTKQTLDEYLKSKKKYKKLVVVADSLPKVIQLLAPMDFENYFLMLDEIDMYQSKNNYRPHLEDCIDYYFKFRHRCMISATIREFTDPRLKREPRILFKPARNEVNEIMIYESKAPIKLLSVLAGKLLSSDKKIVVAHNSIDGALQMISLFSESIKCHCKILCSDRSSGKCTDGKRDYFGELEDGELPARVNFITSTYFTGIDIEDEVDLILVTDIQKTQTLLSTEKMRQIIGRFRMKKPKTYLICNFKERNSPPSPEFEELNGDAQTMTSILESLDGSDFLKQVKTQIQNLIMESYHPIRIDINDMPRIAHLKLDYLQMKRVIERLYSAPVEMSKGMLDQGFKLIWKRNSMDFVPANSTKLNSTECDHSKMYGQKLQLFLSELKRTSRIPLKADKLVFPEWIEATNLLSKYVNDIDEICQLIESIFSYRYYKRKLKSLEVSLKFATLEPNHNLRINILNSLIVGISYTRGEILDKLLCNSVSYLLPSIGCKVPADERSAIACLNLLVNAKRTKKDGENCYEIISYDLLDLKSLKIRSTSGGRFGLQFGQIAIASRIK